MKGEKSFPSQTGHPEATTFNLCTQKFAQGRVEKKSLICKFGANIHADLYQW
jgi:hypothetical protein